MSTQPRLVAPLDLLPRPQPAPLTWEAIYAEHAARVAGWATRLGGPGLDSEDLVHEVFIQVQRLLPRYDGFDPQASPPWDMLAERLRYVARAPFDPAVEFALPSPYVPRLPALREMERGADAFARDLLEKMAGEGSD